MADINKIISDNTGLIYKQLYKFKLQNDEDAYSCALEALGKAAQTYDSSKGYAFSTYATTCIYNGIQYYLRTLNKQNKLDTLSYDACIDDEQDETFLSTLSHNYTPESILIAREKYELIWKIFYDIVGSCDDISTKVILYWKESDFTAKQTEIAKCMNISQSYVSRIISMFKHKLKTRMEEYLCEK